MIPSSDRLLLLTGRSREELREQLAADSQLLFERDDIQSSIPDGPYRLAILNADARRLELAQRVVEGGVPWRGRKDVWFTTASLLGEAGGSVALIFPGLEQRFEPMVEDVAAHFRLPNPDLTNSKISVRQHSESLIRVASLLDTALRRIGVEPAAIAGHSIGEWSAMMSAELITPDSMESFIASVDPAVFELPNCVFAALGCGVDLANEAIAGLEGIVISHDNCPHQSIVCGEQEATDIVVQRLHEKGISGKILNFRSGFHSPFLKPHLHRVSQIAQLPFESPSIPLWSATTTQPFPADEQVVRDIVIRHLLEPVRFRELIENLYSSGVRAFIQVGVGSITGFVDDTLAGREYTTVTASLAGQPGMRQLRRVAAALWVEGAQLHLDQLAVEAPELAAVADEVEV